MPRLSLHDVAATGIQQRTSTSLPLVSEVPDRSWPPPSCALARQASGQPH